MEKVKRDNLITIDLAYRLRYERGLPIPTPGNKEVNYDSQRLRFIAIRQAVLIEELEKLDQEIRDMYVRSKYYTLS